MSSLKLSKRSLDDADLGGAESRLPKRNFTFPLVIPTSKRHDRRSSEGCLLASLSELRLHIPPVESLPQEILLQVFEHLVHPSLVTAGFPEVQAIHYSNIDDYLEDGKLNEYARRSGLGMPIDRKPLRNVCLVSRKFKMAATTLLYRCAHLAAAKSPGSFLLSLAAHPDLRPLVSHISVPWYVGTTTDRYNFAFSHDITNWQLGWRKPNDLKAEFFVQCEEYVEGRLLRLMMPLLPNLRTLTIPQTNLLDGPFTQYLVLHNLTALRISLMTPNELTFYIYPFILALRTFTWMRPRYIGYRFPALRRLEICSPNGRWEANLVTEEVGTAGGRKLLKYVESLKTTTTKRMAPADWDLMSLWPAIFDSSHLHTLEFDGPDAQCQRVFNAVAEIAEWNFDRFFFKKGGGLRTLSLDWECHRMGIDNNTSGKDPEEVYFGPAGRVTTLDKLTNLTHLTISLQALFGDSHKFSHMVEGLESLPDTVLASLFPPSLRTLRISEYILGVYERPVSGDSPDDLDSEDVVERIYSHRNDLRRAEGRELWFRRYAELDGPDMPSMYPRAPWTRNELVRVFGATPRMDGEFELALSPPQSMVWNPIDMVWETPRDDDDYGDTDESNGGDNDNANGVGDGN